MSLHRCPQPTVATARPHMGAARQCSTVIVEADPQPGALSGRMSFQSFNPVVEKYAAEVEAGLEKRLAAKRASSQASTHSPVAAVEATSSGVHEGDDATAGREQKRQRAENGGPRSQPEGLTSQQRRLKAGAPETAQEGASASRTTELARDGREGMLGDGQADGRERASIPRRAGEAGRKGGRGPRLDWRVLRPGGRVPLMVLEDGEADAVAAASARLARARDDRRREERCLEAGAAARPVAAATAAQDEDAEEEGNVDSVGGEPTDGSLLSGASAANDRLRGVGGGGGGMELRRPRPPPLPPSPRLQLPLVAAMPKQQDGGPYRCSFAGCHKAFVELVALNKHYRVHGDKPFACHYGDCTKRFTEKSKLTRHFLIHTGEKPFHCRYEGCGKSFSLDFNLRSHMRTHTGEGFACPYAACEKHYVHQYKLRGHIIAHHDATPEAAEALLGPMLRVAAVAAAAAAATEGRGGGGGPGARFSSADAGGRRHDPGGDESKEAAGSRSTLQGRATVRLAGGAKEGDFGGANSGRELGGQGVGHADGREPSEEKAARLERRRAKLVARRDAAVARLAELDDKRVREAKEVARADKGLKRIAKEAAKLSLALTEVGGTTAADGVGGGSGEEEGGPGGEDDEEDGGKPPVLLVARPDAVDKQQALQSGSQLLLPQPPRQPPPPPPPSMPPASQTRMHADAAATSGGGGSGGGGGGGGHLLIEPYHIADTGARLQMQGNSHGHSPSRVHDHVVGHLYNNRDRAGVGGSAVGGAAAVGVPDEDLLQYPPLLYSEQPLVSGLPAGATVYENDGDGRFSGGTERQAGFQGEDRCGGGSTTTAMAMMAAALEDHDRQQQAERSRFTRNDMKAGGVGGGEQAMMSAPDGRGGFVEVLPGHLVQVPMGLAEVAAAGSVDMM
eukprot:SM000030S11408  [mRNA]  locus=s30:578417:583523:+ [translate_table: standard]